MIKNNCALKTITRYQNYGYHITFCSCSSAYRLNMYFKNNISLYFSRFPSTCINSINLAILGLTARLSHNNIFLYKLFSS